jgi:hypothetical protein
MTIPRAAVLLVLASACAWRRGGEPVPNVSGVYDTNEFLYASVCPGVKARSDAVPVEVRQTPGSASIRMVWENQAFDASVRSDRSFDSKQLVVEQQGIRYLSRIGGHFTDTSFYARVDVRRAAALVAPCAYQLRWAGRRR